MQPIVVLFAICLFGVTLANVTDDLKDLLNLYPNKDIKKIVEKYQDEDIDVIIAAMFITSSDSQDKVLAIENSTEFLSISSTLLNSGVDVPYFVDLFNKLFWTDDSFRIPQLPIDDNGLAKMFAEIVKKIPDTLTKLDCAKKYVFSSDFRNFVKMVNGGDFQNQINAFWNSELVTAFAQDAKNEGIDTDAVYNFIKRVPFCKPL